MSDAVPTQTSEFLAAHQATYAAAAAAGRWLDNHRRVASRTLSEPELDNLLREALAAIARIVGADAVSLLLANDEGTELVGRAAFGLTREVDLSVSVPLRVGVSGPILASGQPRFIDDLSNSDVASDVLRTSQQRSFVGVPLSSGGQIFGVLHATRKTVAPFRQDDAELLRHFADPLAAAIERVRLFEAEREARHQAEAAILLAHRATERVRGLQNVTAALASAATVNDICKIIINHAVPGAPDDGERAIWVLRGSHLVLEAGLGVSDAYPDIPLDAPLPAGEILNQGAPIFVGSSAELAQRWPVLADGPTTSFAGLPLIVEGRRLGVLAVGFRDERKFGPEEKEYLTAIAEQAAIALARAESQAALEEATRVADERREQLDFLAEASDRFSRSLDLEVTLRTVAEMAVPRLTDRCALYLLEGGRIEKRVVGPRLSDDEWTLFNESDESITALTGVGAVIRTGTALYVRNLDDAALAASTTSTEQLALLERVGLGGILILALRARGRSLGALAFVNRRGRPMEEDAVALAEELSARAAVAIDNAQMYSREHHVARQLVESLLPSRLPTIPGLEIAVHYEPATRGLGVGGDFYDVITVDDDTYVLAIGDVQGKGVEAAAVTGLARNTIKAAARFETSPAVILGHLNASLVENILERAAGRDYPWDDARLCTATIVRLQRRQARWQATAASAGHPLPLVRRPEGTIEAIGQPALMLGVDPDPVYGESTVDLDLGATLVLFTDGVSEGEIGDGSLDRDGIAALLGGATGSAAETTDLIARATRSNPTAHDDVVVLTVRVEPHP